MKDTKVHQPPEILAKLKTYANDPKGFLVLSGKNGTGKTFAAKAIIDTQKFKEKFHDSDHRKIITQAELFIEWQNQTQVWNNTLYLLQKYKGYRILCLDDIGTREPSPGFLDFLYAIIDYRWDQRDWVATIITTNLSSKDMREKFTDAFTSRVSSGESIRFEGKDRRINEF